MDSWSTGFSGVEDAAGLKKQDVKGPDEKIKAARDAAAKVIESGVLGDGPHNITVSGSEPPSGMHTLTIQIQTQPTPDAPPPA